VSLKTRDAAISIPRRCSVLVRMILACLTSPQVEAVKKILREWLSSGQLLVTTAVYDESGGRRDGPPPACASRWTGRHIHDNWRTMGMRATGSNDITIEGVFVPDHSVGVRRPKGKWHEFFDVHSAVVWPLVMFRLCWRGRSSAATRV